MSDIATQDTIPLTSDAQRIVELERQVAHWKTRCENIEHELERVKLSLEVEEMAHGLAIRKAMALQQLLAALQPKG